MNMTMNLIKHGNEGELQLIGYIDATNAAEVENTLVELAGRFDSLTLDMEKLEYISSAGLRAFRKLYTELKKKGGIMYAKNVNKSVMEVFEMIGFTRLFRFI